MGFTNIELVRKHLQETIRPEGSVQDYTVRLEGTQAIGLPHSGIVTDSEKIKGRNQLSPLSETIAPGAVPCSLSRSDLVPHSVVVAKDNSMTQLYTENTDFVVNYTDGEISLTDDSAIQIDQSVCVWYYHFTVYSRNTDYSISYQTGELKRLSNGIIADGQIVWVDYGVDAGLFADDVITNAMIEASAQIDNRIDSSYADGAASMLTLAETYLTVSILTQIRAIEVIQSSAISASSRGGMSSQLLEISNRYRRDCEDILRPYLKPGSRLIGPTKS